jgi:C-terminal processing protease CtpA/Prc
MKCFLTGILILLSVNLADAQQPAGENDLLRQSTFSVEQRLLDLAKIWSEAKFSFAYYHKIDAVWDSLYLQFIPRVIEAENDYEYYLELMRFGAHLRDGHSGVFWPRAFNEAIGYPPFEIRKIEGRPVIFRLLHQDDELTHKDIRPGLEIIQIDGKPAAEKIAYWRELMCASTEQALDRLAYFRILTGPRNSNVEIVLREPDGSTRTVSLNRSEKYFGDTNLTPPKAHITHESNDGIGYFQANIMRSPVDEAFAEYIEKTIGLQGLVLDLRYNGGGSDLISFDLISRLIDKSLPGPVYEVTSYRADFRARKENQEIILSTSGPIEPAAGSRFSGWLVVLIGEQSHSATEGGFLSVIKNRPKTLLVGEPTAGSTGQPLVFRLSTGGIGAVCSRRSLAPDSSRFVGYGFQPDVPASLSRNDLFERHDPVISKAFDILREKISSAR